jgi:predicted HTH domain antitoxin
LWIDFPVEKLDTCTYFYQNSAAMEITIPDSAFKNSGMTEKQVKLGIAISLFQMEILTLAQAARLAGLHRMDFQQELAKRKISVHYGIEELREDMKTLNISF